jgi:hypothetical protein
LTIDFAFIDVVGADSPNIVPSLEINDMDHIHRVEAMFGHSFLILSQAWDEHQSTRKCGATIGLVTVVQVGGVLMIMV